MNVGDIVTKGVQVVKANAPTILTGLSVVGLGATAYLTMKASAKATRHIDADNAAHGRISHLEDTKTRVKREIKLTWRYYIPPAITGLTTVACIIGSNKVNGNRTAAAMAAYSLTEKAYSEYKEKVVEQIGANKEQRIRDDLAQKRVNEQAGTTNEVTVLGSGSFLCCELFTMRYFMSDMESLKRAQNTINAKLVNSLGNVVTLDEFYEEVGLPYTSKSGLLGWDTNKQVIFDFTSTLTPDGKPCLAFDYNYVKPLFSKDVR